MLMVVSVEKEAVTLSGLLTVAVALLTMGMDLMRDGQHAAGAICILTGFGIILLGFIMFERGVIQKTEMGRREEP